MQNATLAVNLMLTILVKVKIDKTAFLW